MPYSKNRSKNGPRSNFSLLSFDIQYKIIGMIQDGATFAAIAADREIAEAYRIRGLKLVPPAISRLKKSEQYKAWTAQRLNNCVNSVSDRLTTAFLKENGALETIAEQTKVALLKLVRECVEANPEDTKEVERLVRSVVNLSNPAKDNQIAELKRKLEEFRQRFDASEKEWQAREAELEVKLAEKEEQLAELAAELSKFKALNSGAVIEEMDKFVKGE